MSSAHCSQDGVRRSIHDFVVAGANNELTEELWTTFEQLLRENDEARRLYAEYVSISILLPSIVSSISDEESAPSDGFFVQRQEPIVPPDAGFLTDVLQGTAGFFSSGWPVAYLVATMVLALGLLIGSLVHVSEPVQIAKQSVLPSTFGRGAGGEGSEDVPHSRPTVGRITGMVDCQFDQRSEISDTKTQDPRPKTLVSLGDKFTIASGLMEITYDTGAKVILQGPVTYEVESKDGGYLSLGKLTARVESAKPQTSQSKTQDPRPTSDGIHPSSFIPHPLFSVRTPTATVTDLGTEFGVEVDKQGRTTSHVFRGSVRVRAGCAGAEKDGGEIVLHANESSRTENSRDGTDRRVALRRITLDPQSFVRRVVQPVKMLDLLDIVAGGNGIGHRRERGIDPTTGMEDPAFLPEHRHGNGRYEPVVWYKLIDGVFIPDGAAGPVVLDSAGHRFGGFPRTSGETFGSIWSRAATVKPSNLAWDADKHWIYAMGPGTQYMPNSRGLLHMCPNVGITMNLQAMREMYPNARSVRFRAVAGVASELGVADIWVLVDGQLRMKRTQIRMKDGPIPVDVEIGPDERFLTLVTTDGGDGIKSDWVVFGDPVLEVTGL